MPIKFRVTQARRKVKATKEHSRPAIQQNHPAIVQNKAHSSSNQHHQAAHNAKNTVTALHASEEKKSEKEKRERKREGQ